MTNNNNDNKEIKFTGDPVAFDGVEGKRDPKTGKGRFDLIPEEVFGPLFDRVHKLETTDPYTVDCTPASILNDIANEDMLDAIIKITILKYYNTDSVIDAMCCQIEAGAFLECCWDMFMDLAIHFQKGAEHYGERNCQKGIPKWSFKDSAMRHASQTFAGKTDEPHTISVVWNCWLFVWSEIHERQEAEATAEADKALEEMQVRHKKDDKPEITKERVEKNIDEMRQIVADLMKIAEENEFPIITAIQHFYTREEVEAIKLEAAEKAIEDFLKDKGNIERAICEFGDVNIIDKLEEMPLDKQRIFHKQFVDLLSTPEGKERARWFYGPDDLFKDLIDRVENKRGVGRDYHEFVPLLLQLNSAYTEFLNNDKS